MTNIANSKNSSNIFRRPRKGNSKAPHNFNAKVTGFQNPWRSPKDLPAQEDLKTILFLSKRGMTRAPVAREAMRSLVERSEWFGKVDVVSAGVTKAYDECPIDQRMKAICKEFGYRLQTRSSFANPLILADADIIITLDRESEEFVGLQKHSIRGGIHPLGIYMAPGCEPYVQDPYERDEDIDVNECYEDIISSIEYGCTKLSATLPTLFS
jgi:protein-tyrosine-phosphatase